MQDVVSAGIDKIEMIDDISGDQIREIEKAIIQFSN